jgi:hypothetical protein
MAHALLAWETLDKYQIDALMQGELIAEPEPVIAEAVVTEIKLGQGDSSKKPNLATS